jgi:hypothetical protein
MNDNHDYIGACGLDCGACDILAAADDLQIAEGIAQWFRKERSLDLDPRDIGCGGCRGTRNGHWSPGCWILKCCVDDKGLEYCSECDSFPCDKLREWSEKNERYGRALERLRQMRQE